MPNGQPLTYAPLSERYQLSPEELRVIDEDYAHLKRMLEEEEED